MAAGDSSDRRTGSKFSGLLTTIPHCVLGGATISVFASIAMTGIRLITSQQMNFRNTSVVGLAVALGVGVTQASASLAMFPAWVTTVFGKTPVVIATCCSSFIESDSSKRAEGIRLLESY